MNLKLVVAVVTATLLPLCAYAQRPEDVQRVTKVISSDNAKKQAYCDIAKVEQQIADADQKKDTKKVEGALEEGRGYGAEVGPEYVKLIEELDKIAPESADGKN